MNNVSLIGRLCADPETRYTPKGVAVSNVTLALDDGWGENKKTLFIGLTLFGTTAETAQKYCVKGQQIGVSGRLSQDSYTPKGAEKPITKTHVTVDRLDLLSKPANGPRDKEDRESQRRTEPARGSSASDDFEDPEDPPF